MNSAGKPDEQCEKSEKLPDFSAQSENGRYGSSTVFRPIPTIPYPVFVHINIFTEKYEKAEPVFPEILPTGYVWTSEHA
jgi:hypothetical protein